MSKKLPRDNDRFVVRNRKARYRYEILERVECGISLKGTEIKSLRNREVSLEEAYARISNEELWLLGCHIKAYEHGSLHNHDPLRPRKLLVHKREIRRWLPQVQAKGLTLVPLDMYFSQRGLLKVTIALVRGKSHADKRRDLKKREHQRDMDRAMRR